MQTASISGLLGTVLGYWEQYSSELGSARVGLSYPCRFLKTWEPIEMKLKHRVGGQGSSTDSPCHVVEESLCAENLL